MTKEMKKKMAQKPFQPALSILGYYISYAIALTFLVFAIIFLVEGIRLKKEGVALVAEVVEVIDTDEKHDIKVEYVFENQTYQSYLGYWNKELDLHDTVDIFILKSEPSVIHENNNYTGLSIVLFVLTILVGYFSVVGYVKYLKEKKKVYYLLENGVKKEGIIVASERLNDRPMFGHSAWAVSATIQEKVYNSSKYWVNFNLNGIENYHVDIYIDQENEENYYIDIMSLRKVGDNIMKIQNQNKLSFTCTCLRSYETIMSFKPLFKEGFGGVEIFYPYKENELSKEEYTKAIEDLIRGEELTMVMHLPYGGTSDLAKSDDEEYAKKIMSRYYDAIDYGKKFGVVRYTLHLGFRKTGNKDLLVEKLKALCDYAAPSYIMMENMPSDIEFGAYEEELQELFDRVNKPNLKLIYDTGHGHVAYKNTELEHKLLCDFKDKLAHFHINDNDSSKDQHAKIGAGTVEFEKVLADLQKNQYSGIFSLEILFNTVDDLREYGDAFKQILRNVGVLKSYNDEEK